MEEVTDTVFRRIMREAGPPDLFFTEFTSTDGLYTAGRARVIGRLRFTPAERPLIAQVWGNVPERILRAAAEVREWGFDGIDLNMGCPVRKVVKRGACGGLIETPALAAELIAAAREGAGGASRQREDPHRHRAFPGRGMDRLPAPPGAQRAHGTRQDGCPAVRRSRRLESGRVGGAAQG